MNSTYRASAPFRIVEPTVWWYQRYSRNFEHHYHWWHVLNETPHAYYRVFSFPYQIVWYHPKVVVTEFGIKRD